MSRVHESVSQPSSSKRARLGRVVAVPVVATAVALSASACSSGDESPAPKRTEASPRPTISPVAGLTPELQKRAVSSVNGLARVASLAILEEIQRPNTGAAPYAYGDRKLIGNKAAILSPGPDGKRGTPDDSTDPAHQHTPEMLVSYDPASHELYIRADGAVPQGDQETFSGVDVVYTVGAGSAIAHKVGLLSPTDVEQAVQSGTGLAVKAIGANRRWGFNDKTKKTTGDEAGIIVDSGKFYGGDSGGAILASDPNWIPYPSGQITAPDTLVSEVDRVNSTSTSALSDLNYLSNNVLPPNN